MSLFPDRIGGDGGWSAQFDVPVTPGGSPVFSAAASFREPEPGWLELTAALEWGGTADQIPAGVADLVEELVSFCVEYDATFARAGSEGDDYSTPLESCANRPLRIALEESAVVLRGYSWITYVPEAVLAGLGGIAAVRDGHNFYRVRPLGDGALIRVTGQPYQYDRPQWRAIFEAVQPALPASSVRRPMTANLPGFHEMQLIFEEDL